MNYLGSSSSKDPSTTFVSGKCSLFVSIRVVHVPSNAAPPSAMFQDIHFEPYDPFVYRWPGEWRHNLHLTLDHFNFNPGLMDFNPLRRVHCNFSLDSSSKRHRKCWENDVFSALVTSVEAPEAPDEEYVVVLVKKNSIFCTSRFEKRYLMQISFLMLNIFSIEGVKDILSKYLISSMLKA